MNEGLDTGDVLLQQASPISPTETTGELWARLSQEGGDLLIKTLDKFEEITPIPQDHTVASFAPLLQKSDGIINWDQPSQQIHNHIRGMNPWPGAWTSFRNKPLKIWKAEKINGEGSPGMVLSTKPFPVIATGKQAIRLLEIQLPGKKRTPATSLVHGSHLQTGEILGSPKEKQ